MRRKRKRFFGVLLTAVLMVAMLPAMALAAGPDLTVTGGALDTDYTYVGNDLRLLQPGTYTVSMGADATKTTTTRIVVKNPGASGDPYNITLDSVNIDKANNTLCAFEIQDPSVVNLTLVGNNYLTSAGNNAGLRCSSGSALTIGGTGYLEATGGTSDMFGGGAGIGENSSHGIGIGAVSGTINITGGTVIARGGGGAAGIGGGSSTNCGVVNISGGTVTAVGGSGTMVNSHGAGIGAGISLLSDPSLNGHNGNGGIVTISGGIVTARGVNQGAGIGGAFASSNIDGAKGGTLTVTGGFVEATAGSDMVAGIGGGHGGAGKGGDGSDVLIIGGTVIVHGWIGAGMSTGAAGDPGTCQISGGSLITDLNGMKPTPTNGADNVYLTTVTLEDTNAETVVSLLTTDAGYAYGVNDMQTDSAGRLYLWLPDSTLTTAAETSTSEYESVAGEIATKNDGSATGVLYLDTPPAAAGVSPSGTGVASSGNLVVTFNKIMNTGAAGTVTLNGGALAGGSWTDARTYTVPYAGLTAKTAYAAVIADFQDVLGHTMASAVNHSFTTAGGGGGGGGGSAAPVDKAHYSGGGTLTVAVNTTENNASVDLSALLGNSLADVEREIISMPSIPGVTSYTLGVPASYLFEPGGGGTLTFRTDSGTLVIPAGMLANFTGAEGKIAKITVGEGDKSRLPAEVRADIGGRPVLQLSLTLDGKQTEWNNPDAPVTVSIPYTPTAEELENPESIVVWYIDGSGNAIAVPNGRYDPVTGTVTFTTTHFSDYAVSYYKADFNDIKANAWYSRAVSFIAAREITSGTGSGNFSPKANLTRGQFIVMLMKAYDIAPDTNPKENFADAGSTYYTGYLAAAKNLGISAGVGGDMFAPEKEISRQEMFTLLYNALKVIGQLPEGSSGTTLSSFTDAGLIAPWAKDAMALLVKTETVGGSNGKLTPQGTTTRAEMAQVLYNLLGNPHNN